MPELPEVETVRRGLVPVLVGRVLARVEARRHDLRFPLPARFAARLEGRRVETIGRRAKFMLAGLDDGWVLLMHLGMSGRMRIHVGPPPAPERHDHVVFATDAGTTVVFNDPRRFGFMDLAPAAGVALHPFLARLGPEPLDDGFDGAALAGRLKGRTASIKAALADQRVVAGLGNIYISESLFRAGISPRRRAGTVVGRRAQRLAEAIRAVLSEAIEAGGSTLRDHRQANGELGYFQHRLAVYGRAGEPCPGCACGGPPGGGIRHLMQGGRSTFYCAARQR